MLASGQLCEGRTGGKAHSTIRLVPSHNTCRPWTTVAAGSPDAEDAESLEAACACFSACETKAACKMYFCLTLLLRAVVKEPSHRVVSGQGQQVCGVGRRMCSSIMREGCRKAELAAGHMLAMGAA
jgi:hypothetical protein